MQLYGIADNLWAVIAAQVAFATPYAILVLQQSAKLLPLELDEAARVDGASAVQVYWRIYVPLLAPALAAVGTFALLLAWNDYLYQYLLLSSSDELDRGGGLAEYLDSDEEPWNDLMAAAILYALPPIVIFYGLRRYMAAGLTSGCPEGVVCHDPLAPATAGKVFEPAGRAAYSSEREQNAGAVMPGPGAAGKEMAMTVPKRIDAIKGIDDVGAGRRKRPPCRCATSTRQFRSSRAERPYDQRNGCCSRPSSGFARTVAMEILAGRFSRLGVRLGDRLSGPVHFRIFRVRRLSRLLWFVDGQQARPCSLNCSTTRSIRKRS